MGETLVVSGREDVDLVRRFVRGDRTAFDGLVDRYQVPIFRFLYRMVGDAARAEELAQETFVRVFRSAGGYKPQYRFSTWLYTIARNCARGEMKRNARAPRPAGDRIEEEADRGTRAGRSGPAIEAEDREIAGVVRAALDELQPDHRITVILAYYEGRSYAEISEILGRPRGTIKSWVFRAKRELAKNLKDRGVWG